MACEETIQALLERGNLREVASLTIEEYGPEILTFLVSLMHDETDANDVFAQACEDLWRGLPMPFFRSQRPKIRKRWTSSAAR